MVPPSQHPTSQHPTPQHAPRRHASSAGYTFPRSPISTFEPWDDTEATRLSTPLMSPSAMGSFVTRAKSMLRGKRNSYQAPSTVDMASSGGLVQPSYQPPSARPPPRRQVTAPLLSRQWTTSVTRRPLRKNGSPIQISNPVLLASTMDFKHALPIRPADLELPLSPNPLSRPLTPGELPIQSSPYIEIEARRVSTKWSSSSPAKRKSMLGNIQSPGGTLRTIPDESMVGSLRSRPKSDVFPRSITAASLISQDEAPRNVRIRPGVLSTFREYDSNGSVSDAPDPFEFDSPTCGQSEVYTSSSILGFGVSETMSASNNTGMLRDSGACGLVGDTSVDFGNALGVMFLDTSDESDSDSEIEPAYESSAACPSSLACLSIVHDAYLADHVKDASSYSDGSHRTMDECPEFGEEMFLFSLQPREHGVSPTGEQTMSQIALDVLERAAMFLHRPMTVTRCLETMATGGLDALLTPWRAQLDPTCEFHLISVDAERKVTVTTTKDVAPEQSTHVEHVAPHLPIPADLARTTRSALPRSRSKTMLAVPVTLPPLTLSRRNTSYAQHSGPLSPSTWETISAPPTPSVPMAPMPAVLNPYAVASSSRTPAAPKTAAPGIVRSDALTRKRRNTREMFIESQVAHVIKGSRGMGATRRSGPRSQAPEKESSPVERLDFIYANELDRVDDEENSTDWIVVPSAPALSPRPLPKSPAQRSLYASPSKEGSHSSPRRARGMSNSPSLRGTMVKSPSVRSGLAKSGSRQGLSASQSRSALHVSPSRSGLRSHTRGSPSHATRFPISPSTRSLPGNQQGPVAAGNASPPPRPPRSRVRPRVERRRPSFWDVGEKENLPAESVTGDGNMSGPESPLRCRPTGQRRTVFESHQDPRPTHSHVSDLESLPKMNPEDVMRAPTKMLTAEMIGRNPGAPAVPPRSPARPASRNLV